MEVEHQIPFNQVRFKKKAKKNFFLFRWNFILHKIPWFKELGTLEFNMKLQIKNHT